MRVKTKLREFTYKDAKGYHTIVSEGDCPEDNPEVQKALKSGILIKVETSFKFEDKPKKKEKE
uniref:Uncharacterized protein n=1 Tax=candidate division WOR-3 bacterium TaxID=2052148 RepID=A0A7C6A8G6_UNCW3